MIEEQQKTRILLVDDHPLFRQGLRALLGPAPDLEIVGEAGTMEEVRDIAARMQIDVALVDVWIAQVSGIDVTQELHQQQPNCRILGLSVVEEPSIIAEMMRAGAIGFALKAEAPDQILDVVRQTARGERVLPRHLTPEQIEVELAMTETPATKRLTKREREILELVIRGYTNSEIGSLLFIARRTVETHRYRITKKLNAHTLCEIQRVAARYRA